MKHAYLIIAHKVDYTLIMLLRSIDDIRNDIFIHMDKKYKQFDADEINSIVSKSGLFFVQNNISVNWGGISLIKAELMLFETATQYGHYSYYHLISGQDMPIKSQNYIHDFFDNNDGKEFVNFQSENFSYNTRIQRYHFFIDYIGRNRSGINKLLGYIEDKLLRIQDILNVQRYKHYKFQKGTEWASITDAFARDLVEHKNNILDMYKYSCCCDEIYKQTFIINHGYREKLYNSKFDNSHEAMMRCIDWKRGTPYVWRDQDFEELKQSRMLFARKFDASVDKTIIDKIYSYISQDDNIAQEQNV